MADNGKVLINLATGMEDGERVLVAFLVATAAQQQGKEVRVWTTKDAVRLGLPGELQGVVCKDCPPLERLWEQFSEAGGELWLCPICLTARDLDEAETAAEHAGGRRFADVGMGRRRNHRLQLLSSGGESRERFPKQGDAGWLLTSRSMSNC